MVMPYSIPAVFGTVRHENEPIVPVERYAMYPFVSEENYLYRGKGGSKKAHVAKPSRLLDLKSSIPGSARAALRAAADHSAVWLAQGQVLHDTLAVLTQRKSPFFEQRIVLSMGEAAGQAEAGAMTGQLQLHIASLAHGQRNLSFDLTRHAPSVAPLGTHHFKIFIGNEVESPTLTVVIRPGDTNAAVLGRLRDAINEAKLCVKAALQRNDQREIIRDNPSVTICLELSSSRSGTNSAFTLKDIGGGSIVKAIGIGLNVQTASDAVYSINGGPNTVSPTNDITVWDGQVTIALDRLPLESDVTVHVEPDISSLANRLVLIAAHVDKLEAIYRGSSGSLVTTLKERLDEMMAHPGVQAIGLYRSPDGTWNLDREKLQEAMGSEADELKRLLTGRSGFASTLADELARLSDLPMEDLINFKAAAFQVFTRYSASSEPYLQLRMSGFHLDAVL